MSQLDIDVHWMRQALVLARQAKEQGEVPVGAVLLLDEKLLASASNQTIAQCDPTAHAEILALRKAARRLNNHRLLKATLYVTLEPCPMCIGAIIQARIKRLVFAAYDDRQGALTTINILQTKGINHRFLLTDGLLAGESAEILRDFFFKRRHKT